MATYLLTWNPERWNWTTRKACMLALEEKELCIERWSCGGTKSIKTDDRAFLIRLGKEPRGLVASGWVTSNVYEDTHWDERKKAEDRTSLFVKIEWDTVLDPQSKIFSFSRLENEISNEIRWNPQASGVRIPDNIAQILEKAWAKFLDRSPLSLSPLADEVDPNKTYAEGATQQVTVDRYERSREARTKCINYYGLNCQVCGFNFEEIFGEIGQGFIHVHHLKPLAEIGEIREIKPIEDLRPVCPNCHAMLHQRKPAYSIEELKVINKKAAK